MCMGVDMSGPVFLVMEPLALLAEDIAGALGASVPDATVLWATGPGNALALLVGVGAVDVAILNCAPDPFAETALAAALTLRGASLVFMGDAAEARPGNARRLENPFSDQSVASMLTSVAQERATRVGAALIDRRPKTGYLSRDTTASAKVSTSFR
jgi:hypothetical protein